MRYRLSAARRGLDWIVERRYGEAGLTRLCTAELDGSTIRVVADDYLISHYDWRDRDHILAWTRYNGAIAFHLIRENTGRATALDTQVMPRDGHCSYSPDCERRWILCDTYPDKRRRQSIYLFDSQRRSRVDLGAFYSPPHLQRDHRCDLHPRWSRDGNQICFDSAHDGSRQLYVMDIEDVKGG